MYQIQKHKIFGPMKFKFELKIRSVFIKISWHVLNALCTNALPDVRDGDMSE